MYKNVIITIDGPAGAGKTSLAKTIAERFSLFHIRGGTYFRTLTYAILENNLNPLNKREIVSFAENMQIDICLQNNYRIYYNNKDVTFLLHTEKINNAVTYISNYKEIRNLRKKWIYYISKDKNIIVDGRTFGTEIFPNATVKFYLTSKIHARTIRRLIDYNYQYTFNEIYNSILARDATDTNSYINKLNIPKDAHYIDNTKLSFEQTLSIMCKKIKEIL